MTRLGASATLLLAALLWGSGNVANKTVLDHVDPLLAVGLRSCIAFALLLPLALRDLRHPVPAGWGYSALGLSACFSCAVVLQQYAFAGTSVTNAGFLINTCSIMTPVFAWVLLGERAHRGLVFAALITLTGIFLMTGGYLSFVSMRGGDVVCLVSAAFYALWMVLLGRHLCRFDRPGLICVTQFGISGLGFVLLALLRGLPAGTQITAALPDLLFLGIFATGGAFLLQARAQQHVSASCAAVIASAESLFGAAGAYLLLGERITDTGLIGAALILCGVVLAAICPAAIVQARPPDGGDKGGTRHKVPAA